MARSTTPVAELRDRVNRALASPGYAPDSVPAGEAETYRRGVRAGMAHVLEEVLHDTGNYHGFGYLDGWPCADETRRVYYAR